MQTIGPAYFGDTKPHYELLDGLRGVAALKGEEPLICDMHDGKRAVEIIEQVYKCSQA